MPNDLFQLATALAPTGPLRAAINLGNSILATTGIQGLPCGIAVDLATELARQLGRPLVLVVVDTVVKSVAAVESGKADVGFFAVDPRRAEQVVFTHPYVLIEGCFLVRESSSLMSHEQVDADGRTVVVGRSSAYDLFLSRTLRQARIIRAFTSRSVVDEFLTLGDQAQVAAGARQHLEADAARFGGLRLLKDPFMVIRQAISLHIDRGAAAAEGLSRFVEAMKAGGFVKQALTRHWVEGAAVAPAAGGP